MNKYNIKVGDYVETWDGGIGYVSGLGPDFFCWYEAPYKSNPNIHSMRIDDLNNYQDIANKFKRIGLNDFTKKKDKFGPISKYDKNDIFTYASKLNELIDHINAIQERVNEYGSEKERY